MGGFLSLNFMKHHRNIHSSVLQLLACWWNSKWHYHGNRGTKIMGWGDVRYCFAMAILVIIILLSFFCQKCVRHITRRLLNGNQWNFTGMLSTMSRCADYFRNFQNGSRCHGNHKKHEKFKVLGIGWNFQKFCLTCEHIILRLRNFRMAAVATTTVKNLKCWELDET